MFITIPAPVVSLLTFPGIIVHEIAHKFFCDIMKVPVCKVRYFSLSNPAGYVIHGPTNNLQQAFFISIGPLIINTIFCVLLTFPAMFPIFILSAKNYHSIFSLLLWLGISIGMHAFPSQEDMDAFLALLKKNKKRGVLFFFSMFFAVLLKIVNIGKSAAMLGLLYAIAISWILPLLLIL